MRSRRALLIMTGLLALAGILWLAGSRHHSEPVDTAPVAAADTTSDEAAPDPDTLAATWTEDQALEGEGWRVLGLFFAHYTQILRVETSEPDHLMDIARKMVEPVQDRYVEVLVYFYSPEDHDFAFARVQWTPRDGYVRVDLGGR